ncbi:MAG: phage virion morphogenesis protein [Ramlibacter sp.]|nr:phage virion morphogenesis protein [Ramlibacter sp.]
MLTFNLRTEAAQQGLQAVLDRAQDLRPVLEEIGQDMVESTHQRFVSTTGPDGDAWAPNSAATLANYQASFSDSLRKKDGTLNKRGQLKASSKKPLTGNTRKLDLTINYQVLDDKTVGVGSPEPYAAMQQYGGTKAAFPHLWGDIPARPYLGASDTDKSTIARLLRGYLSSA